jgi:hypothetical protein
MKELIDKAAVVAEIENCYNECLKRAKIVDADYWNAKADAYRNVLTILTASLEVEEVDFPCDGNRDKELALSLQIQAYLNTASDELYGKGKPLYSKSHLEGIHECMKMWAKLHDYYFYKNTYKNKEVDLEKELNDLIEKEKAFVTDNREVKYYNGDSFNHIYELEFIAKYFFELGLKANKGE